MLRRIPSNFSSIFLFFDLNGITKMKKNNPGQSGRIQLADQPSLGRADAWPSDWGLFSQWLGPGAAAPPALASVGAAGGEAAALQGLGAAAVPFCR
jgi:hypothetical protein